MKSKLLLALAAVIWTAACTSDKPSAKQLEQARNLVGQFVGTVPCADCKGIEYMLTLNSDFTYIGAMRHLGKADSPVGLSGTWSFTGENKFKLSSAQAGMDQFEIGKNRLLLLNARGERITGDMAEQYILWRSGFQPAAMAAGDSGGDLLKAKREAGLEFFALGTEPFWSLEMDLDQRVSFYSLTDTLHSLPSMGQSKDGALLYEVIGPRARLLISIKRETCSDGMSDREYPYSVSVTRDEKTTYQGCGILLGGSLSSYWVLVNLNGKPATSAMFPQGMPTLQFMLNQKQYIGTDGCNTLSGKFTTDNTAAIDFEEPFMTRMACPGSSGQKAYRDALAAVDGYKIENMQFILTAKGREVLVFGML